MTHHRSSHTHHHAEKNMHFKASTSLPHVLLGTGVALLSALTLAACDLNPLGLTANKATPTSGGTELAATTTAKPKDDLEAYKQVLDVFYLANQAGFETPDRSTIFVVNTLSPLTFARVDSTEPSVMSYAFHDFDNDGTNELVLGDVLNGDYRLQGMYQLVDGQPVSLFDEGDNMMRVTRQLTPDGKVLSHSGFSAFEGMNELLELKDQQLQPVSVGLLLMDDNFYSMDEQKNPEDHALYYAYGEGSDDPEKLYMGLSRDIDIDSSEHCLQLDWTPIAKYPHADTAEDTFHMLMPENRDEVPRSSGVYDEPLKLDGTNAKIVKTYQKAEQTGLKAYAQSTDDPGIKRIANIVSDEIGGKNSGYYPDGVLAYALFDFNADNKDELIIAQKSMGYTQILAIYQEGHDLLSEDEQFARMLPGITSDRRLLFTYSDSDHNNYYIAKVSDSGIKPQVSAISEYGTKFLVQGDSSNEDQQTAFNQIKAWASADDAVLNWHRVSTFED